MGIDRRSFLRTGVGVAGAAALAGPFSGLMASPADAAPPILGPLSPKPDLVDGVERLALPDGFTYRTLSAAGDLMTDGVLTPGRQDGMAAFRGPRGSIRIVRNHEVNGSGAPIGDATKAYDGNTLGGTTTLEVHPRTRELVGDWVSLNGTTFNCAGGPTPWGTWLSVEETVNGPDVGADFAGNGPDYFQQHGYMYEVDPAWGPGEHPKVNPIRSAGRMAREAAAVDPRSGLVYITEDLFLFPAGIYRYRPPHGHRRTRGIRDGGTLEMLKIRGATEPTVLGGQLPEGATFKIEWVPIAEPDFDGGGASNNDAIRHVSQQGFAQNAAKFARPEGLWYRAGSFYFACTSGAATELNEDPGGQYGNGNGQIWRLDPHKGRLTLIFQSFDESVMDNPDNLTVTRRGNVIVCEDGSRGNYVRVLHRNGRLEELARNNTDRPDDEFAGACMSPDGRTMFVNIQSGVGRTFAIWREKGHHQVI